MSPRKNKDRPRPPSIPDDDTTSLSDTPTHSTTADSDNTLPGTSGNRPPLPPVNLRRPPPRECVPWPGRTYIIRNRASRTILAREHGKLVLKPASAAAANELVTCGWHWQCVQDEDGWLGFRETVSWVYLGRDGKGG